MRAPPQPKPADAALGSTAAISPRKHDPMTAPVTLWDAQQTAVRQVDLSPILLDDDNASLSRYGVQDRCEEASNGD